MFLASVEDDDSSSSDGDLRQPLQEKIINKDCNESERSAVLSVPVGGTKKQNGGYSESAEKDFQKNQKMRNETMTPNANEVPREQNRVPTKDEATNTTKLVASSVTSAAEKRKRNSNSCRQMQSRGKIHLQNEQTQTRFEPEKESRTASPASTLSSESDESVSNVLKGRLNTARLRSAVDHRRHHLDRTTPLRGGAAAAPSAKLSGDISAPVHEFRNVSQDMKSKHRQSFESGRQLRRDDGWKDAKIVRETKPSAVVTEKTYRHDKYKDEEYRDDLILSDLEEKEMNQERRIRNTHYSEQTMQPPRAFVRPSKHDKVASEMHRFDDSDMLSDTSMSARDSIISDVLERSRRRRDEFW